MKATPTELEAIKNLRRNSDFGAFMALISTHVGVLNERLIKQPVGDEYLRGQVFALSDLLGTVNEAVANIERANQPKT